MNGKFEQEKNEEMSKPNILNLVPNFPSTQGK